MGSKISVFLLAVFALVVFVVYKKDNFTLISPVSNLHFNAKAKDVNSWFPKGQVRGVSDSTLSLGSKSAILVNYDTGEILFSKHPKEKLPVASVVKIMTALLALENKKMDDTFTVSEKAAKVGENSMGLTSGEKLSLRDLLYGLILVSGNDAAVTIAEGVSGDEGGFVLKMNQKVKEIGLSDTKFANASGLDDDNKTQYSSAYDMAVLGRFLWNKYPEFRLISETYHQYIEPTSNHKEFDLYNDTNLLTSYPGVKGIKPGFTWEAGLCLVTYAENGGKRLIGVILGSSDRRGEMKELLDYGFGKYGIKVQHPGLDLQKS